MADRSRAADRRGIDGVEHPGPSLACHAVDAATISSPRTISHLRALSARAWRTHAWRILPLETGSFSLDMRVLRLRHLAGVACLRDQRSEVIPWVLSAWCTGSSCW